MATMAALPRKLLTLAFLVRERAGGPGLIGASREVLLGEKKRGFGLGKWNGFGGKVEASDASVAAAAAREVQEEANVAVRERDLEPRGVLTFTFEGGKELLEVHVFLTTKFEGEPSESDEMRPQWFALDAVPFDQMWADDHIWLPHVLVHGKSVRGHFHFAADELTILEQTLDVE